MILVIEETEELRALQRKLEINGYLTERDLQQIRKIQDEQFEKKFGKLKGESNQN